MAIDKEAFDLFAFLGALNKRDLYAFDKLSDESKKAAHPLVVMRWLSGTSDPAQIIRINEVVNKYVFSLSNEKALLFKLLAAACTGRVSRNNWIKGPAGIPIKLSLEAIKAKFECSTKEAQQHLQFLDETDIVSFAEQAGWDKEQLKKLMLEFNKPETKSKTKVK